MICTKGLIDTTDRQCHALELVLHNKVRRFVTAYRFDHVARYRDLKGEDDVMLCRLRLEFEQGAVLSEPDYVLLGRLAYHA